LALIPERFVSQWNRAQPEVYWLGVPFFPSRIFKRYYMPLQLLDDKVFRY
jgi:hypothetical protein